MAMLFINEIKLCALYCVFLNFSTDDTQTGISIREVYYVFERRNFESDTFPQVHVYA